jgi:hypothetical protein
MIKEILESLNKYSTLILVIITGIYAYFTYKMAKTMSRQIVAEITISNILVGSALKDQDFLNKIKNINNGNISRFSLDFYIKADVFNKCAGAGAITKPILELEFEDGFIQQIRPEVKSHKWKKIDETTSELETTNYGSTLFMGGGCLEGIELEYNCDLTLRLLEKIKINPNPTYFIKYIDNRGKEFRLKADNIIIDDQFEEEFL